MSKLVRLYPHNPKRGWFLQTYLDVKLNLKFVGARGWYEVDEDVAKILEKATQKYYDKRSGPAFMIADDREHAKQIETELLADPEDEKEQVGTAEEPVRVHRPGKKSKGEGAAPKARTRRKKVAGD